MSQRLKPHSFCNRIGGTKVPPYLERDYSDLL